MSRVLPHPVLSGALLAMWLLLHHSVAPASLLGGTVLALLAPHAYAALEKAPLRIGSVRVALRLAGVVLWDITRSNLAVARIVLGGRHRERVSGFVSIALDMTNPYGLAFLAVIITSTPGTLWVQYDSRQGRLLLHVLDLVDPEHWVTLIKQRYERKLMEIFP
jgi:multicomponent K+:H+ antiporter subunit E